MEKFVLYEGKVWRVIREEHYGDERLCLATQVEGQKNTYWVSVAKCEPLDPALNILFERKENEFR